MIKYIFNFDDLQMLINTFILNDVKIEVYMRIKVFIHEKEN